MKANLEADIKGFMETDISNRLFGRMCQILSRYRNKIGISYKTMESCREQVDKIDYTLIPDSLIEKIKLVNCIELATKNTLTSVNDFLKGEINSDLCRGIKIEFTNDPDNSRQIIELKKHEL